MNHTESLRIVPSGDRALVIERTFDAPAALVWRAMTEPHLLRRWMSGPPGWSMSECENNLTVGGTFRHVWTGPEGARMAMSGEYREIDAPRRVVRTERFEFGCENQAGEQLGTLELRELPGDRSAVHIHVLYPSAEARDGALGSGMEQGMAAGYQQLDALLGDVQA